MTDCIFLYTMRETSVVYLHWNRIRGIIYCRTEIVFLITRSFKQAESADIGSLCLITSLVRFCKENYFTKWKWRNTPDFQFVKYFYFIMH